MKKFLRKNNKNQQGVTLIEILVAMMIFGFIVGGVVLFGVRSLESHTKSQTMQKSLENARFVMESMMKKIRTSQGIKSANCDGLNCRSIFFNNSADGKAYCYTFNNYSDGYDGTLLVKEADSDSSIIECDDITSPEEKILESDGLFGVAGYFKLEETEGTKRGIVRMKMTVYSSRGDNSFEKDAVVIQSAVSLRDY